MATGYDCAPPQMVNDLWIDLLVTIIEHINYVFNDRILWQNKKKKEIYPIFKIKDDMIWDR